MNVTIQSDYITSYPDCSYVASMKIEADPDIGGIGASEAPNIFPAVAKTERKLIPKLGHHRLYPHCQSHFDIRDFRSDIGSGRLCRRVASLEPV